MYPVAVRNQYSHLYGSSMLPALEELFRSEYNMHPSLRELLYGIKQTTRDIWQYSEIHDMRQFLAVAEGEEYTFDRPKQGASKTLTITKYGLGASISEEAVDDGKFDMISDILRKMGRSAKETQEVAAMALFNNGFTSETTADGQFVFDSDHSLPSGGTFRNLLATAADLSPTSLEQALIDFETQFVGDSGIIEKITPKILLVPTGLKRYAKEIVGSDKKPDTADNNLNPLRDDGLTVVASPHLTDPDAWFLLADKSDHGLRIINRKAIETKAGGPDLGFKTDSILYKSRYREAIGATHAKGIFGSPGA